jgi:hypothetical protein
MSTHPQRKGCWKFKKKIIHPFKKKKEVGGKEKKLSGHSIRECDWWGKEFFSLRVENHKIVQSFQRRTLK